MSSSEFLPLLLLVSGLCIGYSRLFGKRRQILQLRVGVFSNLLSRGSKIFCLQQLQKINEGRYSDSEYLPFDLSFLEFTAFQVALHHTLVEFLSESIKEIGATVVLASLHIHIDVVAVLDFHAEDVGKSVCQLFYTDFSVVDTVAGVKGVKEFDQICSLACPVNGLPCLPVRDEKSLFSQTSI